MSVMDGVPSEPLAQNAKKGMHHDTVLSTVGHIGPRAVQSALILKTMSNILDSAREGIRLAEAATKGPWITGSIPWKVWADGGYKTICDCGLALSESMAHNRDLIAHCGTHHAAICEALLTAVEALVRIARTLMQDIDSDRSSRDAYSECPRCKAVGKYGQHDTIGHLPHCPVILARNALARINGRTE